MLLRVRLSVYILYTDISILTEYKIRFAQISLLHSHIWVWTYKKIHINIIFSVRYYCMARLSSMIYTYCIYNVYTYKRRHDIDYSIELEIGIHFFYYHIIIDIMCVSFSTVLCAVIYLHFIFVLSGFLVSILKYALRITHFVWVFETHTTIRQLYLFVTSICDSLLLYYCA